MNLDGTENGSAAKVEVKASIPKPDWKLLVTAIASAIIGWLMKYLEVWQLPGL